MFRDLGVGLGLRPPYYERISRGEPKIDWVEVISENFMPMKFLGSGGRHKQMLHKVRSHYPIVMHGVSLSLASANDLNFEYLDALKIAIDEFSPEWVSDHLCWSGVHGRNLHDLLPFPHNKESLQHVADKLSRAQDYLGRTLLIENVSSYVRFASSEMSESEFLRALVKRTGCKLLLDVNNVYVSSVNFGWNAFEFIKQLPDESVAQIHIAGHTREENHIIDTHDAEICDEVWELYSHAIERFGSVSTLLERDGKFPEFDVLALELDRIRRLKMESLLNGKQRSFARKTANLVQMDSR